MATLFVNDFGVDWTAFGAEDDSAAGYSASHTVVEPSRDQRANVAGVNADWITPFLPVRSPLLPATPAFPSLQETPAPPPRRPVATPPSWRTQTLGANRFPLYHHPAAAAAPVLSPAAAAVPPPSPALDRFPVRQRGVDAHGDRSDSEQSSCLGDNDIIEAQQSPGRHSLASSQLEEPPAPPATTGAAATGALAVPSIPPGAPGGPSGTVTTTATGAPSAPSAPSRSAARGSPRPPGPA